MLTIKTSTLDMTQIERITVMDNKLVFFRNDLIIGFYNRASEEDISITGDMNVRIDGVIDPTIAEVRIKENWANDPKVVIHCATDEFIGWREVKGMIDIRAK